MPEPAVANGRRPTVAVVGGGIAGLAAAWELTGGVDGRGPTTPDLDEREAGDRPGGKLRTEWFAGRPVDVGPDSFLSRRPEATDLCGELGLGDELEPIGASGAELWARGRARVLPSGLALGVPTRFWPAARSGILGWAGSLRLLVDVVAPRPDLRGPLGDRAIGPLVARKLGQRVVDTLVDPLVGGIHAGGVTDMSAAALYPLLIAVAQQRGSFMRALRKASAPTAASSAAPPQPAFLALRGGTASLVTRLAERLAERGVRIRADHAVRALDRSGARGEPAWVLQIEGGAVAADGVVLAVPAGTAAALVEAHDGEAARQLRGIEYASVAVVTLSYPEGSFTRQRRGTGLLVPAGSPAPAEVAGDRQFLVTACTYLSDKWPHLARPGDVLLRASVGRLGDERPATLDDEELAARAGDELRVLVGARDRPSAWHVARWPAALPQYRVHHLLRVSAIDSALRRLPALAVAGAAYQGVGIPACVGSGRAAAQAVMASLEPAASEVGRRG